MPIIFKGSGNKKPKLYDGYFSSYTSSYDYTPNSGYDGFSSVYVYGYSPYYTDGNASQSDVRSGKTFYSDGYSKTGNMSDVTLPSPSVEHSFSADKTQITFTVSYTPPSTGYNSSATQKTNTTYIDMPETTIQGAVFQSGTITPTTSTYQGATHWWLSFPLVSGKTLKHVAVTRTSRAYSRKGSLLIQCIRVNGYGKSENSNDNTIEVISTTLPENDFPYNEHESFNIASNDYMKILTGTNTYEIVINSSRYSACNSYQYIAVYE